MFAFSGEQNGQNKTNTADNKKSQNWTKSTFNIHPYTELIIDTATLHQRVHNHPAYCDEETISDVLQRVIKIRWTLASRNNSSRWTVNRQNRPKSKGFPLRKLHPFTPLIG
jgi:hypothetical protein